MDRRLVIELLKNVPKSDVETKILKRAVRRNIDRFPYDFMFELSKKEMEDWRCQFGTSNADKMGLR